MRLINLAVFDIDYLSVCIGLMGHRVDADDVSVFHLWMRPPTLLLWPR